MTRDDIGGAVFLKPEFGVGMQIAAQGDERGKVGKVGKVWLLHGEDASLVNRI